MSNTINSMPNRLSMTMSIQRQSQDKSFGEKMNNAVTAVASNVGQGTALIGNSIGISPVISAAISSVNSLSSASAAQYSSAGVLNQSNNTNNSANLLAGINSSGVGTTDIAEMSRQNAQMLQVQIAMQRENTMFSSISNVLKTKHDTAKNSIGNIR